MTRPLFFVGGLLLVATLGLIVWLAVAPDTSAPATAPIPAAQVAPPVSTCERALLAKLLTTENALQAALDGHVAAARHLFLGESLALPRGCGVAS